MFSVVALAAMTVVVAGCGTTGLSTARSAIPTSRAVASASATPAAASAPSSADGGTRTFPPPQTAIEPGTYLWDGFERPISVDVGAGWAIGHHSPSFFDLFRGSAFPSISFARFTDVYADGTERVPTVDAASVATTLANRTDMTLTDPAPIELGGLGGRQFDLATSKPQTPLFFGPAGDFKLDPEFKTRYRVLDFPGGGVLVIGIHARDGGFDDAVALADPLVSTLTVER